MQLNLIQKQSQRRVTDSTLEVCWLYLSDKSKCGAVNLSGNVSLSVLVDVLHSPESVGIVKRQEMSSMQFNASMFCLTNTVSIYRTGLLVSSQYYAATYLQGARTWRVS